jgi:hypothetical protein
MTSGWIQGVAGVTGLRFNRRRRAFLWHVVRSSRGCRRLNPAMRMFNRRRRAFVWYIGRRSRGDRRLNLAIRMFYPRRRGFV